MRSIIPDAAQAPAGSGDRSCLPPVSAHTCALTSTFLGPQSHYAGLVGLGTIIVMDPLRLSGPEFAELLDAGEAHERVVDAEAPVVLVEGTACLPPSPHPPWSGCRPWLRW